MLKRNLFFFYSAAVVSLASVILCVFNYNPYEASPAQLGIFYFSLFAFLTSAITLILFYLKLGLAKKEVVYSLFWPSFRQSTFLAAGTSAWLILKGLKLFDLWVAIPLLLIIILLELFFQTKKRPA